MEKNLARYIWSTTRAQQAWILFVVAVSMIPYFLSFDLPKQIINGPIQGIGFEKPGATQTFMRITYDFPILGEVVFFNGLQLTRIQMLIGLSMVFLLLVVINGLFKLYINTYKGRLGERMLRRIRFELVDRVLRFPPFHFKRVRSAEIATMIKDEVEPLGGFTGDAFVQPALLGGQALTALVFILMQNFWLGMIAAIIVAAQGIIIPRMRKRLLELGRQRQLSARELSGRVGEIVDGISAIHSNDTSNFERADIANRLGHIFSIRYDLYQWKFLVKFINNFLAQVTPFLFYMIGGILALQGRLDIGQLVAVINAYKDLPGPLKELIDWDQNRQDVQVKYAQVVEQFSVDNLIAPKVQSVHYDTVPALDQPVVISNVTVQDDSGAPILEHVSLELKPTETVALIGPAGSGSDVFAELLGRLVWPATGRVAIDGHDLLEMPESVTGRRIAYASGDGYFFSGSLRDNLLYGLRHAPLTKVAYEGDDAKKRQWQIAEARRARNPDFDLNSDWVDYAAMGISGRDGLYAVVRPILDAVMVTHDIFDIALLSKVDTIAHPEFISRIVELRQALRKRLDGGDMAALVIPFEPDVYNAQATVGENLLFGVLDRSSMTIRQLAAHPFFREVIGEDDLLADLYAMSLEIAENAIELFRDLPPDHPFFQQLTFMRPEDIPEYETLLQRVKGLSVDAVSDEDRVNIVRLSFSYIEPRHRFGLLTDALKAKILKARTRFLRDTPDDLRAVIEPYELDRFIKHATLLDNLLFGKISYGQMNASDKIRSILIDLFEETGQQRTILIIGLDFDVGSGGKRLTSVQRQKINMARALLKHADYVVFNRPLPSLDQRIQFQIAGNIMHTLHKEGHKPAIIWALSNFSLARDFDRVIVFDHGRVVQDGTYEALMQEDGPLKDLLS
ncbi:ABC transporter ATP-binding protein [Brucellaceae bacterium VT-16-1752]|uniref:ABC transporter ATP-binding protein n=1 Tax=Ochrobactrum soli TaxID=2448455 RepID=A0A849KWP5_9HYPH|nr:ABC transporter ATP-binding protein [[Ochrobactrum] soli]MCI1000421.1 ABC transporter ATP-binding protein [Ochrobactrum sp. C6C9]NNU60012.1 ABC transporter ATP-binding protein [[Ochrobactrum] soli]RRD26330.1 ABC transporter ATP-binding protein [Brucellaceae bacterium VT-16-1752]